VRHLNDLDDLLTSTQRRGAEGRRASAKLAAYRLWKSGSGCNSCRAPHYRKTAARRVRELIYG
jgi:hypothetical protein